MKYGRKVKKVGEARATARPAIGIDWCDPRTPSSCSTQNFKTSAQAEMHYMTTSPPPVKFLQDSRRLVRRLVFLFLGICLHGLPDFLNDVSVESRLGVIQTVLPVLVLFVQVRATGDQELHDLLIGCGQFVDNFAQPLGRKRIIGGEQ